MTEQLVVVAALADGELAACELFDLGALAVEERARIDGVELVAGFGPDANLAVIAGSLRWARSATITAVDDDGRDRWREHAAPTVIGPLAIVPAWLAFDGEMPHVVRIEPGRAFGIGDHPATRLALAALIDVVQPGDTLLDVGCGTGVLAIAAARLGAQRVVAIDIDPHARGVALANVDANGVNDVVSVRARELADIDERFDVVVANLGGLETPLRLRDDFMRVADSSVVVSGLLDDQVDAARAAFAGAEVSRDRGWAALIVRRDPPASCTD